MSHTLFQLINTLASGAWKGKLSFVWLLSSNIKNLSSESQTVPLIHICVCVNCALNVVDRKCFLSIPILIYLSKTHGESFMAKLEAVRMNCALAVKASKRPSVSALFLRARAHLQLRGTACQGAPVCQCTQ